MHIERDGADCIVAIQLDATDGGLWTLVVFEPGECIVGKAGCLPLLRLHKSFALAIKDQLSVVDEGHTVRASELFGFGTDEIHMRAFFEDKACGLPRIAKAFNASACSRPQASTVHEESVELDASFGGKETSPPCIEGGIVFQHGHGGFNGVEGGSSTCKHGESGLKSIAHT